MNGYTPQSWFDFPMMTRMDPRTIIQAIAFEDQGGTMQNGAFTRSATWLQNVVWADAPMIVTPFATVPPAVTVPNTQDFISQQIAIAWNASHAMTATNTKLPKAVEKIMYLKAGAAFVNNIFLDWAGVITSTDIQFSFRDNSATSGDFTNSASGTIPVFTFPTVVFGGTSRRLTVTLLRAGRFSVGIRIFDSAGNWSLYEMDWIVMP